MRHPTTGISEGDLSRLTGSSSSTASCVSNNSSAASSKSLHSSHSSSSSSSSSSGTPSPNGTPTPSLASSTPSVISATSSTTPAAHLHHNNSEHSPEKVSLKNNINTHKNNNNNNHHELNESSNGGTHRFNSTYLPEIINPLEWQKSRKRKDRLDSTSSASVVDRKLQRSNSEELLPGDQQANADAKSNTAAANSNIKSTKSSDTIRRVASEDFQRTKDLQDQDDNGLAKDAVAADENDSSWANRQQSGDKHIALECWVGNQGVPTKDMRRRGRYETSPARSHRLSPIRHGNGNNKHRDSDDSECEHERRRSSERFSKTRAPPSRKTSGVIKKSQSSGNSNAAKYLPGGKRNDENAYKYDLSSLKYERRGFISKKVMQAPQQQQQQQQGSSDHNDNNLIDFHQQQKQQQQQQPAQPKSIIKSPTTSSDESITSSTNTTTIAAAAMKPRAMSVPPITSAQEALPWGRAAAEDQAPVLSRRYATVRIHPGDSMDTAAKLSKVMPYPQQYHKQFSSNQQLLDDMYDAIEPLNTFRGLTSLSSVHTSEVMQQVLPAMISYQSPDERMKQINKRMAALKKKLAGYEEAYEARLGFRPSQAERLNDKHMKHILAELSKLRKERHEIKTEPVTAMGMKVSGDMDETKKLEKMKLTLLEIEENLTTKRVESHRSIVLEELTADQLVQEKTAVQHGLLYFESLYGRPTTKDERDAARPLYDRYRQLKRLVSRSVVLSGSIAGVPELPTILEHEAMVFEATPPHQNSSNNSSDNSPTEATPAATDSTISNDAATTVSSDDSTTTTTAAAPTATTAEQTEEKDVSSSVTSTTNSENVGLLSIDQLWEHFERTNEEKKLLKRSIREYELIFEEQTGRKMLKNDRRTIEETFAQYKEKKAKARLLQALIKKQIQR